ncbi:hypothetical protein [Streptomyces solaniscabiei]|uniref:hypothetical protein n=1 Tax=Streptomyces solaniscabiei TaxID=2683255 RepID=UPI001CE34537|nr:hypothetical protein [Streptomyces solaniscabiei]
MLTVMAHRPYPAAARAWRQIMRRYRYDRPPHLPAPCAPQGPVGEYVLSARGRR